MLVCNNNIAIERSRCGSNAGITLSIENQHLNI